MQSLLRGYSQDTWVSPGTCVCSGRRNWLLRAHDPKDIKTEAVTLSGSNLGKHTPSFPQCPVGSTGQSHLIRVGIAQDTGTPGAVGEAVCICDRSLHIY